MGLTALLAPDERVARLAAVDLDELQRRGIRGLLIDLDNTITPWHSREVADEVLEWLRQARARFAVCVMSNTTKLQRLAQLRGKLGVPTLGFMHKPFALSFKKAMRALDTEPQTTAMIGDQLFTDIFGARRLGLYTILVRPIGRDEFIATKLLRLVERAAFRLLRRRGLLVAERAGTPHAATRSGP